MKQFLYGVLFTLSLSMASSHYYFSLDKGPVHSVSKFLFWQVFGGRYILDPIEGNCVDRPGQNGHGWKFDSVADYYDCDRFQRLLNWNFKAPKEGGHKF